MLTYKRFENINHLTACCEPDPNPPNGTGDCCYDSWTIDLADINSRLKTATTIADHKQKHFDAITNWYATLKAWCDDWENADQLSDTLCRNLELFIKHLHKVCAITTKTSKAIEILFCMIRELYIEVDLLKIKYDELYKCINCLKQPELQSGGVRDCLDAYGVKLVAVIATRDDIIAKVILAIELSYELHDNLCDSYGLKGILHYWKKVLNCECTPVKPGDEDCDCERMEPKCDDQGNYTCELWPRISLPISDSAYFRQLLEHKEETKKKMHHLKKESSEANELKAALQACQAGLTGAIQSVDSVGKCK